MDSGHLGSLRVRVVEGQLCIRQCHTQQDQPSQVGNCPCDRHVALPSHSTSEMRFVGLHVSPVSQYVPDDLGTRQDCGWWPRSGHYHDYQMHFASMDFEWDLPLS